MNPRICPECGEIAIIRTTYKTKYGDMRRFLCRHCGKVFIRGGCSARPNPVPCPHCSGRAPVISSDRISNGRTYRRECRDCGHRFTVKIVSEKPRVEVSAPIDMRLYRLLGTVTTEPLRRRLMDQMKAA